MEDLGLAQQIQKGLPSGQMKAIKWCAAAELEEKKASLTADKSLDLYSYPLTHFCMNHWARANGIDLGAVKTRRNSVTRKQSKEAGAAAPTVDPSAEVLKTHWPDFSTSSQFTTLAKWMWYKDKLASQTPDKKEFVDMRPLGKGAFGLVSLEFKKDTGIALATKHMGKLLAKSNKMLKDIKTERDVLKKINSRFCVALHYAWQDADQLALVLTLMPGGDLKFMMQQQKPEKSDYKGLPDGCLEFYTASMACGLEAIHKAGYVYRDLKPMNVLLDANGQVRLSDMGLAKDVSAGPVSQKSGTRGYWSPETIKGEKYTYEPDWWSLGVTMFVLFSDRMPFHGKTDEAIDEATCKGEIDYKHGEPADVQSIISALCTIDTSKRLGCSNGLEEIKGHSYFTGKNFDWVKLERGEYEAPYKPNVNDINAPGKDDVKAFKVPDGIKWEAEEQEQFKSWDYFNGTAWEDEAVTRIKKTKELEGGGGGGGCCTIA
jgi:serine/threonine protein kinase